MKVDTVLDLDGRHATITRTNMTSGIVRRCDKVTVDRNVPYEQIGNLYFFKEHVFTQFLKDGTKRIIRVKKRWAKRSKK